MSLIKGKQELRTILDFSTEKVSKSFVRQALRSAHVCEMSLVPDTNECTFVDNYITIGMYKIKLIFSIDDWDPTRNRFKEYGGFRIAIYENRKQNVPKNVNILKDGRFKNQYWSELNDFNITTKILVDIIIHLKRLDNLKSFL